MQQFGQMSFNRASDWDFRKVTLVKRGLDIAEDMAMLDMNDKFHAFLYCTCYWYALFGCNCRCEAFSTYPRTYDLLHAWTVFSDIERKGCSAEDLLIEMDRILRPKGFIIVRDKPSVVEFIKKYLQMLHWETLATADADQDSEQEEDDRVLIIIQKKIWLTSESLRELE